jgi:ferrochelatase
MRSLLVRCKISQPRLVFTAHSIPVAMAQSSPYVGQLEHACAAVASAVNAPEWTLAYQSRSGPPSQPWLEPDIADYLKQVAREGTERGVVIAPIGFLSDHMEVIYDLDTEARALCDRLGLRMARAGTVETHPKMIEMIEMLIREMESHEPPACAATCCAALRR